MKPLPILLIALCLVTVLQVAISVEKIQNVGGDFGRAWLNNGQAQKPETGAQDDDLFSWGGVSKGNNTANQSARELNRDWLGTNSILENSNLTKNNTTNETAKMIPYHISKTFSPIHEMDASFNQTILAPGLPKPDKNGLIKGIPAETYYAIGPAYFDF